MVTLAYYWWSVLNGTPKKDTMRAHTSVHDDEKPDEKHKTSFCFFSSSLCISAFVFFFCTLLNKDITTDDKRHEWKMSDHKICEHFSSVLSCDIPATDRAMELLQLQQQDDAWNDLNQRAYRTCHCNQPKQGVTCLLGASFVHSVGTAWKPHSLRTAQKRQQLLINSVKRNGTR